MRSPRSHINFVLVCSTFLLCRSTTKSIGGHSDVIGGALIVRKGLPEVADKLRFLQNASGAIPSPFDCYLLQRSLKTLALRSFQHSLSALAIARHLSSHPAVETVIYPGLATSRSYELAKRSQSVQIKKEMASRDWDEDKRGGIPFGGMISFRIKGGAAEGTSVSPSSSASRVLILDPRPLTWSQPSAS